MSFIKILIVSISLTGFCFAQQSDSAKQKQAADNSSQPTVVASAEYPKTLEKTTGTITPYNKDKTTTWTKIKDLFK